MRTLIAPGLTLFAALLAAGPLSAGPETDAAIQQAVLATNTAMTEAADRLDADAFFAFILDSDKGSIVQNGEIFQTRQEALDAVKRGFQGVTKVNRQFNNPKVTVISPDVALLVSDGTTTATLKDGQTMARRFAVSLLFVRTDGKWKLLHGHYSMPGRR